MKKIFCLVALCISTCCHSQDHEQAIDWLYGSSWEEIIQKAQFEHKDIFVDCYATWCKPCKVMDNKVYTNDTVGQALNSSFLSVKLQMDTSSNDNNNVQRLYATAKMIGERYGVAALPTFLFFTSDGKLLYKDIGGKSTQDFVSLTNKVVNLSNDVDSLLAIYKRHELNLSLYPVLIDKLSISHDNEYTNNLVNDYINLYLDKLEKPELLRIENLRFLSMNQRFLTSKNQLFRYSYKSPELIDRLLSKEGFSRKLVEQIISREEIQPAISEANENNATPDWKEIERRVKKKYNQEYAKSSVLNARVVWYRKKGNAELYLKYLIEQMNKRDLRKELKEYWDIYYVNVVSWHVFELSNNKSQLKSAFSWMDIAVSKALNPGLKLKESEKAFYMDTKANIMYKLGLVSKAIELEEQAINLSTSSWRVGCLEKMKAGEKTWGIQKVNLTQY